MGCFCMPKGQRKYNGAQKVEKGITQSMSRKATCLDNAVAENFFGLLKTELFYLEKFDSIDQLEKAIIDYIDYYNNRRKIGRAHV